jgi:hypothetical protein
MESQRSRGEDKPCRWFTQIMSLRHLAPVIQERILGLPAVSSAAEEGVNERQLRGMAQRCDWREQMRMWEELESGQRKSTRGGEERGRSRS